MTNRLIRIKILRSEPEMGVHPEYETFEIQVSDGMSVLNALDLIYNDKDGSLAYYDVTACQHGICGRCTVLVNDKPVLACATQIEDGIRIAPLPSHEIVRDLVVKRKGSI